MDEATKEYEIVFTSHYYKRLIERIYPTWSTFIGDTWDKSWFIDIFTKKVEAVIRKHADGKGSPEGRTTFKVNVGKFRAVVLYDNGVYNIQTVYERNAKNNEFEFEGKKYGNFQKQTGEVLEYSRIVSGRKVVLETPHYINVAGEDGRVYSYVKDLNREGWFLEAGYYLPEVNLADERDAV